MVWDVTRAGQRTRSAAWCAERQDDGCVGKMWFLFLSFLSARIDFNVWGQGSKRVIGG